MTKFQFEFGEVGFHLYPQGVCFNGVVTVNRVEYKINGTELHCVDGEWKLKTFSNLYMRRTDGKDAYSFAARDKFDKSLTEAWNSFISVNPELMLEAQKQAHKQEIDRLKDDIAELVAKIKEKSRRIRSLKPMVV